MKSLKSFTKNKKIINGSLMKIYVFLLVSLNILTDWIFESRMDLFAINTRSLSYLF